MEIQYEENLFENAFYKKINNFIQTNLNFLVESENLILCVPRRRFVTDNLIKSKNFCASHILIADKDLPKSHYTNLHDKKVVVNGKSLTLFDAPTNKKLQVKILFEEIYYTKDLNKFKIFCIDFPLIFEFSEYKCNEFFVVSSISSAEKFLETQTTNPKTIFKRINSNILSFKRNNNKNLNVDMLKTNVRLLFTHCMEYILLDRMVKEKCRMDSSFLINLKLSVEYYLMDKLYDIIFDNISTFLLEDSKQFNKIIRKLSDIDPSDLDIDMTFDNKKLEAMQHEFFKINDSKTSLDKLQFLKNTIDIFSRQENGKLKTVDDLLPMLVFLVCKSEYSHWVSTLQFIKEFNLAQILDHNEFGAQSFLCTTLEAVIYYIQTDEIKLKLRKDERPAIFELIRENLEEDLVTLLTHQEVNDKCIDKSNNWNPLHAASAYGLQKILFLLLHSCTWDINATTKKLETPLILAAKNGQDLCVKTLLYFAEHMHLKIRVNCQDIWGNTALHYSAKWGFDTILDSLLEYNAKTNIKNKKNRIAINYAYNSKIYYLLESADKYQFEELPVTESEYIFLTNEDLADDSTPVEAVTIESPVEIHLTTEINGNLLDYVPENMCHPLCSCDNCLTLIESVKETNKVSKGT